MRLDSDVEHFVTLFDSNFLPMGICLHASLTEHGQPFHLWVVCMDELVEQQLRRLALPNMTLMPLREVETEGLLKVKSGRNRAEYCWTLTPFTPQFVFDRDENVRRVTYLDADLYFFDAPQKLLNEFEASGKDVLITRHAYAPEYEASESSGIFCVQFMTFRRTPGGLKVMSWWQERCLEWCFHRLEDGKLGDQMYLDDWPERFASEVHVLRQEDKTLAPWNVGYFLSRIPKLCPVIYHFHSLRITSPHRVLLYSGYKVGAGIWIYLQYVKALKAAFNLMGKNDMPIPARPTRPVKFEALRRIRRRMLGIERWVRI